VTRVPHRTLTTVLTLVVPALLVTAITFGRPLQHASTAVQDQIAAGTTAWRQFSSSGLGS